MKLKSTCSIALLAATSALLVNTPLFASDTDSRIESSAAKSYVFKTYLQRDSIKTESKDGNVTLTGTVSKGLINHWLKIPSRVCPESSV